MDKELSGMVFLGRFMSFSRIVLSFSFFGSNDTLTIASSPWRIPVQRIVSEAEVFERIPVNRRSGHPI
jgi:hypothetical protein